MRDDLPRRVRGLPGHPFRNHWQLVARRAGTALFAASIFALLGLKCGSDATAPKPDLAITPPSVTIGVGESIQLSVRNATSAVVWTSSNESIASVVSTGFVTAKAAGTATITVAEGSRTATAQVTVQRPAAIGLAPTSASFAALVGGADPAAQAVQITNLGDVPLTGLSASVSFAAGQPTGWLTATLGGVNAPATLTLRAATGALAAGVYSATVGIAAGATNSPQNIVVTFTVTAPTVIALSTQTVTFTAILGAASPAAQTVNVTNSGGGTLSGLTAPVTFAAGQPTGWLTAALNTTTAPATLTLTPATATLASGTYTATVAVTSGVATNSPRNITVTLTVTGQPTIVLSANTASFSALPGGANPATKAVNVTNGGAGSLSALTATITYTAGQPTGWLAATFNTTTAPATLTLAATTGALASGAYTATVAVANAGATNTPQNITVTFTLAGGPVITLSANTADFTIAAGTASPANRQINVTNTGSGTLSPLSATVAYTAGPINGWLATSFSTTTAPAVLTLTPTLAGLTPGTYKANVSVNAPGATNGPQVIAVTATVPGISLGATVITFSQLRGSGAAAAQNVAITNSGPGTVSGLLTTVQYGPGASGWLSTVSLNTTTAPATLTLQANTGAIPAGTYTATVNVSSPTAVNSPQTITVTFNVLISLSADIYPSIGPLCTGCHFAGGTAPDLSTSTKWQQNLVNKPTTFKSFPLAVTHPTLVVPFSASTSYLIDELKRTTGSDPMPPSGAVSASVINLLILWINQGALNN
jgi:hypothetical protein